MSLDRNVHLIYWYTFRHFLENHPRPLGVNEGIRALLATEKRMLRKLVLEKG